MSVLTTNLWKSPAANTKVPALTHYLSYRLALPSLTTAATTVTALPANYLTIGQLSPQAGIPSSYASTFTQPDPNSEPQIAGTEFVVERMVLRYANGTFVGGGTAAVGSTGIYLFNQNVSAINATTGVVTRTPGTVQGYVAGTNGLAGALFTASATGSQPWTTESSWEFVNSVQNTTGSAQVPPTPTSQGYGATGGWSPIMFRPGLGDSLAVAVVVGAYTAGTAAPTATAVTLDISGFWRQAF